MPLSGRERPTTPPADSFGFQRSAEAKAPGGLDTSTVRVGCDGLLLQDPYAIRRNSNNPRPATFLNREIGRTDFDDSSVQFAIIHLDRNVIPHVEVGERLARHAL